MRLSVSALKCKIATMSQTALKYMHLTSSLLNLLLFCCRCAYHPGAFGRGEAKTLSCSKPLRGRYLFVTLKTTEILTVCEVEVFAVRGKMRFYFKVA